MVQLNPWYESSHALLIGIDDYPHCPPLSYACSDAKAVGLELTTQFGFAPGNVRQLLNENATRASIMRSFLGLATQAVRPDDRIVLFFAGHGEAVRGKRGNVGYVVPYDGKRDDLSTLIRVQELIDDTELLPAKHILMIFDSCFSGLALKRRLTAGATRFLRDVASRRAVQILTAGKADQQVADGWGPTGNNSLFTGHLLEGLRGGARRGEILTANDLMQYVYRNVSTDSRSDQTPEFGTVDGDGDFVFLPEVSKGSHPPDGTLAPEARESFEAEHPPEDIEALLEEAGRFRNEGVERLQRGKTPKPMATGAAVMLHVISADAMRSNFRVELRSAEKRTLQMWPIHSRGHNDGFNAAGYYSYDADYGKPCRAYVQFMREGKIEAVDFNLLNTRPEIEERLGVKGDFIPSVLFEQKVNAAVGRYTGLMHTVGLSHPMAVTTSLVGVKGFRMAFDPRRSSFHGGEAIEQEVVLLPVVLIDSPDADVAASMRMALDELWQTMGYPGSLNYDSAGRWVGPQY